MRTRLYFAPRSSLDETTIREMWRFRLRFMRVRPGVDPETDFEKFLAVVRTVDTAQLMRDESGQLCGMMVFRALVRTFDGRRFLWLLGDYGFLDPAYRGGVWFHLKAVETLHRLRRSHGGLPAYVITAGWPSGFLAYRVVADVRMLGDPAQSEWERRMLASIGAEMGGDDWDAERLRMRMRVVPDFPFRSPTNPRAKKSYEYYLEHNPEWMDGYTAITYYKLLPDILDWVRILGGISVDRIGGRIRRAWTV